MKSHFFFCIVLINLSLISCSLSKGTSDNYGKPYDLYILAGQSNMAGRGVLTDSTRTIQSDQVWMLTKNLTWEVAKHPVHFDKRSAGVGPGLSFGLEMAKVSMGRKIGLIPCAVGGTSIDKWQPGAFDEATSTYPYDDAVVRITEAIKYGKVKGIIWLQGEADSNEKAAAVYLKKLKTLIFRIRRLTREPNLPVVVGELGHFKPNFELINTQLRKAPLIISNLGVASSDGFNDKGDRTHFDSRSAIVYGIRFAQQMQKLQQ